MSSGTDNFKLVIEEEMKKYSSENPDFLINYNKPEKNIEDCCQFIYNEVHKLKIECFTDEEVFDLAKKYYNTETEVKPQFTPSKVISPKQLATVTEEEEKVIVTKEVPKSIYPSLFE